MEPGLWNTGKGNMDIKNRKTRKRVAVAAVAVLSGFAVPASAGSDFTPRWYGGVGVGISELEPDPNRTAVKVDDSRSSGGKIFLGYDLTKRISIEGHYADLGEAKMAPSGEVDYREFALGGLYYLYKQRLAHEGFGLFAKGGLGKMENDTQLTYERLNDYSFFYGAGLEYAFRNGFALRGELDLYDKDARFFTVSLMKRFGGGGEEQAQEAVSEAEAAAIAPAPVPAVPQPKQAAALGKLDIIYFHIDSAALTPEAQAKLDRMAGELRRFPDVHIEVQGHTDARASEAYNMNLSQRRARAVVDYLSKKGIARARFRLEAFGESRPAASNDTEEGMRLNRRVEFRELGE